MMGLKAGFITILNRSCKEDMGTMEWIYSISTNEITHHQQEMDMEAPLHRRPRLMTHQAE